MTDFSSMSAEKKRRYLEALGIKPPKPPLVGESEVQAERKEVAIRRERFSKRELALLRKMTGRTRGALNVAFHEILGARLVDVQVGMKVAVEVCPHKEGREPSSLGVCEAIELGLGHLT